ncbi:MAG: aminotransferase class I/II-fold pyridoxal phosphate-dependent enzyme [Bryobacteraceae bacterium]|nr:aminotransferase class I/II-fold pyridoxal phosphate-dependent enzyme [Bryobacteraceae bacterium]
MTRRHWIGGCFFAPELAFAQHAAIAGAVPPGTIWLNANESPEGPPKSAVAALRKAAADAGRYSHRAFPDIERAIAAAVGLGPEQILLGSGSSQVLHCALQAFTGPGRGFVTSWPTWEMCAEMAGRLGAHVVKVPMTRTWAVDVERMAQEARRLPSGLVHLGNPNNPTSSMTPPAAISWLAENLPEGWKVLIDEAYMDYVPDSEQAGGIRLVKQGRPVIVTRTFSKLFGLAGARIGFGCARPELVAEMRPFRENVVSILGARAAVAALAEGPDFVARRRESRLQVRAGFCRWLDSRGLEYIPPSANFVLIHVRRPVTGVIPALIRRGIAPGRRFDSLDGWLRLTIGTRAEMDKVTTHLPAVLAG